MGYVKECEATAHQRVAEAEMRIREVGTPGMQRAAEVKMLEAAEELDRIQLAGCSLFPGHRGRFVKCTSCGNPFHDEGSYLAHWRYGPTGRLGCERTASILKVMGFVSDEYRYPGESWPEYVLRHPDRQTR
ncbi:hypothetical protein AB1286_19915 [Trinickia sp. NRRL B-1857]|uniref:hypothetical protein n=1 Tax=Trinickia sp. NRRL B-1857 TaxID=3162879 RepID=UPI003D2CE56A